MNHFHAYEPTLASAAFDLAVAWLLCLALLTGLLWLGRWVVSLFERQDRRADASTYADEERPE